MKVSRARSIAFDVLRRVATQDAYADESLRAALANTVGAPDAGLATELTLGVLRWQRLLDFLIDRNLTKKTKTLDIEVRIALRMGIYQLYFLDRVPPHAAVHESVELVKQARKRSAAPLVNAVLRKSAKESSAAAEPAKAIASLIPRDLPRSEFLGIEYSHPAWMVERWQRAFGEDRTVALLRANNRVPELSAFLVHPRRHEEASNRDAKSDPACSCETPGRCTGEIPPRAPPCKAGGLQFRMRHPKPWRIYWRLLPGITFLIFARLRGARRCCWHWLQGLRGT